MDLMAFLYCFKKATSATIVFTISFYLENALVWSMIWLCFKVFGIEKVLIKVGLP
jgi:hypothetical protein